MSTQEPSLEDLIEGTQATEPPAQSEAPTPETGDTLSAATPADATPSPDNRDDGPLVPRRALEDERKKRQEYERQLQEMQRQFQQQRQPVQHQPQMQPEAPDPWVDPQGYAQWVTQNAVMYAQQQAQQQVEFQILNRELNRSEKRARAEHGDDAVTAAFEAASAAGVARSFLNSEDAYGDMVKWHNDYQIATNPDQHRARIEAEILAKHGLAPSPAPKAKAPVPRTLASTPSAQPRDDRGRFQELTPLEDLLP